MHGMQMQKWTQRYKEESKREKQNYKWGHQVSFNLSACGVLELGGCMKTPKNKFFVSKVNYTQA